MAQLVTINVAQLVTIKMAKRGPISNFTAYNYIYIYLVSSLSMHLPPFLLREFFSGHHQAHCHRTGGSVQAPLLIGFANEESHIHRGADFWSDFRGSGANS